MRLFTPCYYIRRFDALRVEFLKEKGIKLLICDIDNTLVAHDEALPSEEAKAFLKSICDAGIEVIFISNNNEARVSKFANEVKLPYYSMSLKPLPITYLKALKAYPYDKKQIAVLGDQIMTDMIGANLMGFYTILCEKVVERDLSFTKFNRIFENLVFKYLKWTKKLVKGEYDE